jgi:hypothetical protein
LLTSFAIVDPFGHCAVSGLLTFEQPGEVEDCRLDTPEAILATIE